MNSIDLSQEFQTYNFGDTRLDKRGAQPPLFTPWHKQLGGLLGLWATLRVGTNVQKRGCKNRMGRVRCI